MTSANGAASSRALQKAARATERAARVIADRDDAIRAAVDAGHSMRAVAAVCGLSFQRVQQLARAGDGSSARRARR